MSKPCPLKAEAKAKGLTRYNSPVPCSKGHIGKRSVANGGCVECMTIDMRERARRRREKDPRAERQRATLERLKSHYGMTADEYSEMWIKQNGCCAICATPLISRLDLSRPIYFGRGGPKNAVARVDHDHACCPGTKACGKCVRGLLCGDCNNCLGKFQDDETILLNAVRYLRATSVTRARGSVTEVSRACDETAQGEKRADVSRNLGSSTSRGRRLQELSPFFN
jgi:hypothetical protein